MFSEFTVILPEIFLLLIVISAQLLAVFWANKVRIIVNITIYILIGMMIWLLFHPTFYTIISFANSFETSSVIYLYKALIMGFTIMSLVMYQGLTKITDQNLRSEFITLILLSTLGLFIAISARDFILLFCGIELSALCGYALTAFNYNNIKSSEAGLKYFILGALISCLMLFGISFLYGFSGSIYFIDVRLAISEESRAIGLIIGAIFVLAALLFKLSAAPFHIWTPDVYEGAPISAVSYFATAQKMAILIILIHFITIIIGAYDKISVDLIKISAILSIIIGSLGAVGQSSLKRLMGYSTILNVGYVLIGVSLNSGLGLYSALLYMFIYAVSVFGFFACIVALFGHKSDEVNFDDLKNIAATRKTIAVSISILMFSMIGIPPFAGFFGKYYIFYNAITQGEFMLALLGVISSVIAAFYYLKVIKYMYFVQSDKELKIILTNKSLLSISFVSVGFILFFFIFASSYLY